MSGRGPVGRSARRLAPRVVGRLAVAAALLAAVVAGSAPPAGAHDVGSLLGNYETRLTAVDPAVDGVEVAVIEGGNRLEVRNDTDEELVVLGYEDEPYLRIGPDGVFENVNSPATYLNADREGSGEVPERADPSADPEWRKISSEPVARWHDHRIHWMSASDPPAVQAAPDEQHVVIEGWVVPLVHRDQTIEVVGDLLWLPPPSPAVPAVIVLIVGAAVTATGLLRSWRAWSGAAVLLLVATCTIAALGLGFFSSGSFTDQLVESLADALYLPFLLAGGVASIVLLVRNHPFAPYLTIFTGAVGALFGGIFQARMLVSSVLPTALDPALARGLVALTLGLGVGLLGAGVLAIVRTPTATAGADERPAATPA